jgi:hypothetical protein
MVLPRVRPEDAQVLKRGVMLPLFALKHGLLRN